MRISELSRQAGVPIATIKFYLREGLLQPGERTSRTQAEYGEHHLRRLRLITALSQVAGLSIQRMAAIIALIDHPGDDLLSALGAAVKQLPPYLADTDDDQMAYRLADDALSSIGRRTDVHSDALGQLGHALQSLRSAGVPITEERLRIYADHMGAIADYEVATMPDQAPDALAYAVVGMTLCESVLLALRRIALQEAATAALQGPPRNGDAPGATTRRRTRRTSGAR